METRQELEERLEIILTEIMSEVKTKKGLKFDGDLEESIELLREVKNLLKQLNRDDYINDDFDEDSDFAFTKNKLFEEEQDDDTFWDDDDY